MKYFWMGTAVVYGILTALCFFVGAPTSPTVTLFMLSIILFNQEK